MDSTRGVFGDSSDARMMFLNPSSSLLTNPVKDTVGGLASPSFFSDSHMSDRSTLSGSWPFSVTEDSHALKNSGLEPLMLYGATVPTVMGAAKSTRSVSFRVNESAVSPTAETAKNLSSNLGSPVPWTRTWSPSASSIVVSAPEATDTTAGVVFEIDTTSTPVGRVPSVRKMAVLSETSLLMMLLLQQNCRSSRR